MNKEAGSVNKSSEETKRRTVSPEVWAVVDRLLRFVDAGKLTMVDVAEAAGISRRHLYNHKDKQKELQHG